MEHLKKEAATLLAKISGTGMEEALFSIELAKPQFGDLSSRLAFVLAGRRKEPPAKIAAELAKSLGQGTESKSFERIEAAGPYINFYFSNGAYAKLLASIIKQKQRYGAGKRAKKKVIVEYPSVNPNKPWHIGHLRNALIGDSIANTFEFSGMRVERIDYIDDLGLQVAQSLWGVLNLGRNAEGKFDLWLGQQYVDVAKAFNEKEDVQRQVREYVHRIEQGNNEMAEKGRKLSEECVRSQYETAFAFSVYHDALVFESDIMSSLFQPGLEMLKKNNAIIHEERGKNAGCWVVRLPDEFEAEFGKMTEPDKVLIRSDGTATYTGKDVIFHLWKFGKLKKKLGYETFLKQPNGKTAFRSSRKGKPMGFGNADMVVNIIGQEQKYPQRVVAEVLKRLGFGEAAKNLVHLAYEHVGLPEQQFSGRAGTWVGYTADELLTEAEQKVSEKIKGELPEQEKAGIIKAVGAGAIRFAFLRTNPEKKIVFTWEEALNMEGDSGPYVQYAYVRTNGILGKSSEKPTVAKGYQFNPEEKLLLKKLAVFPDMLQRCVRDMSPHHLCQYVLDLSGDFSGFYKSSPVLKAEKPVMKTRLAIVEATNTVLGNSLALLGMEKPERM